MDKSDDNLNRFVEFILTRNDDHLGDLTVEKVMSLLNVGRSQFYQGFKDRFKFSPGVFLVMIKLIRAASMIEMDDDISIKKVSRRIGFSSSEYFARIFRQHLGTNPAKYRELVRKRMENANH